MTFFLLVILRNSHLDGLNDIRYFSAHPEDYEKLFCRITQSASELIVLYASELMVL